MTAIDAETSGLQQFARFASPPNQRGYCGPEDHRRLLAYLRGGTIDAGLATLAEAFVGPRPYLETIAHAAGTADVFRHDVVEAYWIGGTLLDDIDDEVFARALDATFADHPGSDWARIATTLPGGLPHHSFHVLVTYPWVGFLGRGRDEPLRILDQCRIRWGQVESVAEDGGVRVRSEPLVFDDGGLALGPARTEDAAQPIDGLGLDRPLEPGDGVALHWDWICDRLTDRQLGDLRRYSADQLRLVNDRIIRGAVAP